MKKEVKSTNKSQKGTNMRKVISMILVTVLLGSSATYAWFTLSNNAKVTGLSMTAQSTDGGLMISDAVDGPYKSTLKITMPTGVKMYPATVANADVTKAGADTTVPVMYKPDYDADDTSVVTGVTALTAPDEGKITEKTANDTAGDFYYYEKEFYIKAPGENTMSSKVFFKDNTGADAGKGTFLTNDKSGGIADARDSIRISFTADGKATKVYSFGTKADAVGTYATEGAGFTTSGNYGTYTTLVQQDDTTFVGGSTGKSAELFTITNNTPQKVTMRIWFEGRDKQCVNEIMAENILGQLAFSSEIIE